jgi:hypothetical protein
VFHGNFDEPVAILLESGEVVCAAVSPDYEMIACGTAAGLLLLIALDRHTVAHSIDLNGFRPYAIQITAAWGFVVVFATRNSGTGAEHVVAVYSMNGRLIRRRLMQHPTRQWTSWAVDGFDYLLVGQQNGSIMFCEAFWLDFRDLMDLGPIEGVVAISYSQNQPGVVVVTAGGEVLLLPWRQDDGDNL